jgi:hypothetical protein
MQTMQTMHSPHGHDQNDAAVGSLSRVPLNKKTAAACSTPKFQAYPLPRNTHTYPHRLYNCGPMASLCVTGRHERTNSCITNKYRTHWPPANALSVQSIPWLAATAKRGQVTYIYHRGGALAHRTVPEQIRLRPLLRHLLCASREHRMETLASCYRPRPTVPSLSPAWLHVSIRSASVTASWNPQVLCLCPNPWPLASSTTESASHPLLPLPGSLPERPLPFGLPPPFLPGPFMFQDGRCAPPAATPRSPGPLN